MADFESTSIGYKTIFQQKFNEQISTADKLAMRIESADLSEDYTWLGNFPKMKEWIGERIIATLKDYGYSIKNKRWEDSISVPRIHIEFDKIGVYVKAIEQMAVNAKQFGGDLVAQMIVSGHLNNCYDGKKFFATDHVVGEGAEAVTYSNMGSLVLNPTNLLATRAYMMSIKAANGNSLHVDPNVLVIGPKSLSKATAAVKKQTLSSGESNDTYEMFEIVILPEITGDEWFLLDTKNPVKPFILQVAKDSKFTSSDDDKFKKDDALFGVDAFMNAGYGLWQFAFRSSGVA